MSGDENSAGRANSEAILPTLEAGSEGIALSFLIAVPVFPTVFIGALIPAVLVAGTASLAPAWFLASTLATVATSSIALRQCGQEFASGLITFAAAALTALGLVAFAYDATAGLNGTNPPSEQEVTSAALSAIGLTGGTAIATLVALHLLRRSR